MSHPYRIGIAGLGTVGAEVIRILTTHADRITRHAGRPVEIVAVSARNKDQDRGIDLSRYDWIDNPADLADDKRLDAVIELMGGADGPAQVLVEHSLMRSRAVVTANKALLATRGGYLAALSSRHKAPLMYEAAVAGGIPIIKILREGLAANKISAVYGILNGTCNYILTAMRETGRPFNDVLAEAQAKGYAEADPAFDVDGVDTAHKLCVLSALAYGVHPSLDHVSTCGISRISSDDIRYAEELGYRIKLLGISRCVDGKIAQSVEPCLVRQDSPMGAVDGVFNAVYIAGDFAGTSLAVGRGAGGGPTASAVVADIIDLARGHGHAPVFGMDIDDLSEAEWDDPDAVEAGFYIYLTVQDRPGVLAAVSAIMRDHGVSIEVVLQRGRNTDRPVAIVMLSHAARRAAVNAAADKIAALDDVVEEPHIIRIEDF